MPGTQAPISRTRRYQVYAGARQVAEVVRDESPAAIEQSVYYLHDDHLGSTRVVTNETGEAEEDEGTFSAFGQTGATFSSGVLSGFTGHNHDAELGLVNMKGRLYDPRIGRFVTPDPFVSDPFSAEGLNRYSYVRNNPINRVDPSGFVSCGWNGDSVSCVQDATPVEVDTGEASARAAQRNAEAAAKAAAERAAAAAQAEAAAQAALRAQQQQQAADAANRAEADANRARDEAQARGMQNGLDLANAAAAQQIEQARASAASQWANGASAQAEAAAAAERQGQREAADRAQAAGRMAAGSSGGPALSPKATGASGAFDPGWFAGAPPSSGYMGMGPMGSAGPPPHVPPMDPDDVGCHYNCMQRQRTDVAVNVIIGTAGFVPIHKTYWEINAARQAAETTNHLSRLRT